MPENKDNPDLLKEKERPKSSDSCGTTADLGSVAERLNEKLESLGFIAGAIAHDFNNIVTAIQGNIALARMVPSRGEDMDGFLDEIDKAAQRASQLAQQLLTFSRTGVPSRKPLKIGNLVNEAAILALKGSKVRHDMSVEDGLWMANADEGMVNQAIYNLVMNAEQTMKEGGVIAIRLENVDREGLRPPGLAESPFVKILIKDSDSGILKEDLGQVFDPVFASKSGRRGLGLATAWSIVKKHEGTITVKSEIGKGTEYSVYLPALTEKPAEQKMVPPKMLKVSGRILVVEDEEQLRKIMRDILSRLGYEVVVADEAESGINRFKEALDQANPFDLAIIDLTLPGGMGGKDLLLYLQEIDPGIKAIITSGYSNDPVMADFKKYGFKGSLVKPYRLADLDRIVKQVLNESSLDPGQIFKN